MSYVLLSFIATTLSLPMNIMTFDAGRQTTLWPDLHSYLWITVTPFGVGVSLQPGGTTTLSVSCIWNTVLTSSTLFPSVMWSSRTFLLTGIQHLLLKQYCFICYEDISLTCDWIETTIGLHISTVCDKMRHHYQLIWLFLHRVTLNISSLASYLLPKRSIDTADCIDQWTHDLPLLGSSLLTHGCSQLQRGKLGLFKLFSVLTWHILYPAPSLSTHYHLSGLCYKLMGFTPASFSSHQSVTWK